MGTDKHYKPGLSFFFSFFFLHDLKWRTLFGSVGLGARWPRFKPQLCHLVAVRSLAPDFSALSVTCLLC